MHGTLCMAEPGMPKNVKMSLFLSSCFPGLTQDCLHLSSQFGYDSTPFRSAHVHNTMVLLVSKVYFLLAQITIQEPWRFGIYTWHSILLAYKRYAHAQKVLSWWNACDLAEHTLQPWWTRHWNRDHRDASSLFVIVGWTHILATCTYWLFWFLVRMVTCSWTLLGICSRVDETIFVMANLLLMKVSQTIRGFRYIPPGIMSRKACHVSCC